MSARAEEILREGTNSRGPARILEALEFGKPCLEVVRNEALALNLHGRGEVIQSVAWREPAACESGMYKAEVIGVAAPDQSMAACRLNGVGRALPVSIEVVV